MKRIFQSLAALVAIAAATLWLAAGANRGWTKTSVVIRTLDPVTGIEGINYQKRFVPGVDFLAAGLVAAGILTGVSLLYKGRTKKA